MPFYNAAQAQAPCCDAGKASSGRARLGVFIVHADGKTGTLFADQKNPQMK